MKTNRRLQARADRRGTALVTTVIVGASFATLSSAMLMMSSSSARGQAVRTERLRSSYVAEAALNLSYANILRGNSGVIGSASDPVGIGGSTFFVEAADLGGGRTGLVATGLSGGSLTRVEMVALRAFEPPTPNWGAFGDEWVQIDSNSMVDSFRASDGSYGSQDVNRMGSKRYATTESHVGSNGTIGMNSNTVIFGTATTGPGGSMAGDPNVQGGSIQSTNTPVTLDPVTVPNLPMVGSIHRTRGNLVVPPVSLHLSSLVVNSNARVTIVGPATYVIDYLEVNSNSELYFDTSGGPVEVFVTGDLIINSNSEVRPLNGNPADLSLQLSSTLSHTVRLSSNIELTAQVYAPEAHIDVSSNSEVFGSVVARRLTLNSNSAVHQDLDLGSVSQSGDTTDARWGFRVTESGSASLLLDRDDVQDGMLGFNTQDADGNSGHYTFELLPDTSDEIEYVHEDDDVLEVLGLEAFEDRVEGYHGDATGDSGDSGDGDYSGGTDPGTLNAQGD